MSSSLAAHTAPTPTDELLAFRGFAIQALDMAIDDAMERVFTLPDGEMREKLTREIIALVEERRRLRVQNIAIIANSPEVQAALRGLTAVVADLEGTAARLQNATNFLKQLAKVTGFAKQVVDGIEKVKEAAA
jgi:chromosome segregation ATPase